MKVRVPGDSAPAKAPRAMSRGAGIARQDLGVYLVTIAEVWTS
jgi:hypothetical protein